MKSGQIGIIGGSGVYKIEGIKIINEHELETPFGKPSDKVLEAELEGVRFFFLPRHSKNHSVLPHEINYRANIFALKMLGVSYLVSASAVGSLKEEYSPGTYVLPDQFIDWTKGKRDRTFFGEGVIAHVSVADPIEKQLQEIIYNSCKSTDIPAFKDSTYVCIEGPQFSSRAESHMFRSFGAGVIGMTNVPESYLAKEAGMAYSTIAMVTDYDCWKEEACDVEQIMKIVHKNTESLSVLLKDLLPKLNSNLFEFERANKIGLMSPLESLSEEKRKMVEVLLA